MHLNSTIAWRGVLIIYMYDKDRCVVWLLYIVYDHAIHVLVLLSYLWRV